MEKNLIILAFIGVVALAWAANRATAETPISFDNTPVTVGPNGCDIKGNVNSTGKKVYHMKGCEKYNDTTIKESKGEKWFCSPEEAEKEGFVKSKNCP